MKLSYFADTDSLYIDLADRPAVDSREVTDGVVLDFDADGNVVGIDIDHASTKLSMDRLVLETMPASMLVGTAGA